jgi:SAM-dependent methyltransferase
MDPRLERERAFHDRAFAEDVRASAKRFYAVSGALLAWYENELAPRAPGAQALEYGCGPGSRAFHLARSGARVVGIDISPVAIEQAQARAQADGLADRLDFRVMNAEQLEFPRETFDIVCGSGILHHLDLVRSYGEIARVLKTDGIAVFTEPLGHNPAINAYRKRTPAMRTVDEHPLRVDDLALAERFFAEVGTSFFSLSSLLAIPLRERAGFERIVGTLDGLDRLMFRVMPSLRRHAWMVGVTLRGPRPVSGIDDWPQAG